MVNPQWEGVATRDEVVDVANAWVARFAPLVLDEPTATVPELKERIASATRLQDESASLLTLLSPFETSEPELAETVKKAMSQLPSLEDDLRKRLARLAPGDPAGIADYRAIQDRLQEREARQELGVPTEEEGPSVLDLKIADGNWAAAVGLGVFAFGWNSFTLVHCVMMIGGMSKAIGWGALGLLGFYAIFFGVGALMAVGSLAAASQESVHIDGCDFTATYKLGFLKYSYRRRLDPTVPARVGAPERQGSSDSKPKATIVLTDEKGRELSVGQNAGKARLEAHCAKINAYLAAQDRPTGR
ncbi:MAG: hypothetical protein JST30_08935 [Armatimonadetes bacterium]|nr:hypothetical protein [Armatimonadota bacterium]